MSLDGRSRVVPGGQPEDEDLVGVGVGDPGGAMWGEHANSTRTVALAWNRFSPPIIMTKNIV